MTPEGKVKDTVKQILKAHDVYYFMPVSNGMGAMGVFDFVCCVDGVFLGIECKSDAKKQPTPLQIRNAQKAMNSGGVALLIHKDNVMGLGDIISRLKERAHGFSEHSIWPVSSDD